MGGWAVTQHLRELYDKICGTIASEVVLLESPVKVQTDDIKSQDMKAVGLLLDPSYLPTYSVCMQMWGWCHCICSSDG
jgi:hypothetical protein